MLESFETVANAYPKVTAICIWSLCVLGALWEYRVNKRRHLFGASLLFLFGVLAFWISMLEELGSIRWILVASASLVGIALVVYLRRQPDRESDTKQPAKSEPSG